MKDSGLHVLLADDDIDDCMLFEEALQELSHDTLLSIVNDGEQLTDTLFRRKVLPNVLFLDLNMPRKNGYECLREIASDEHTRNIPVIIISTSFDSEIVRSLYQIGAKYYIRKPEEFGKLKQVVSKGLSLIASSAPGNIAFNNFVLTP